MLLFSAPILDSHFLGTRRGCFFVIALTSHSEFYLTTGKMNHLSKREQKEFIHFADRENGRIKSKEK